MMQPITECIICFWGMSQYYYQNGTLLQDDGSFVKNDKSYYSFFWWNY